MDDKILALLGDRSAQERITERMVKSMPTRGGAGCPGDEKDFVFYIVGSQRDAGRGGSGKEI